MRFALWEVLAAVGVWPVVALVMARAQRRRWQR